MSEPPPRPDLAAGIPLADLAEGKPLLGTVAGAEVLLVRRGDRIAAVGALCPHRRASLATAVVVDDTLRCPLHHACFRLADGAVTRGPALTGLPAWTVHQEGSGAAARVRVGARQAPTPVPTPRRPPAGSAGVVIVGAGAAGLAAATALREGGFGGPVTLLGDEAALPYDRTALSKTYLADGSDPAALALLEAPALAARDITVRTGCRVTALDPARRTATVAGGEVIPFDALVLATGSGSKRPPIPGAQRDHVHTLRTYADADRLRAAAAPGSRVVLLGAGFIGMELAGALRGRGCEVAVVAPDAVPLARPLGARLGRFLMGKQAAAGVQFHLGVQATGIGADTVTLADGRALPADLVVLAVGAAPALELAQQAGLRCGDGGVLVDRTLRTSSEPIYAAGDICRWPDPHTGQSQRVEHWSVAQRLGDLAGRNILGADEACDIVPFFWTRQANVSVALTGIAAGADRQSEHGDVEGGRGAVAFWRGDAVTAVATVAFGGFRLRCEAALERGDQPALRALLAAL